MKTYLLQSFLLLFGITAAHGQVNLPDVHIDSSDKTQKSINFSRTIVRRNRIRDYPELNRSRRLISFTRKQIKIIKIKQK